MTDFAAGVAAERARVAAILKQAGVEAVRMVLAAGVPIGTPHQRAKARVAADAYARAVDAIRIALESEEGGRDG